jgi:hypothetical protein
MHFDAPIEIAGPPEIWFVIVKISSTKEIKEYTHCEICQFIVYDHCLGTAIHSLSCR